MTDGNGWALDKRYVEGQLADLKAGQTEGAEALARVEAQLVKIETELLSYKRAAQILIAIASVFGAVVGWLATMVSKIKGLT